MGCARNGSSAVEFERFLFCSCLHRLLVAVLTVSLEKWVVAGDVGDIMHFLIIVGGLFVGRRVRTLSVQLTQSKRGTVIFLVS